MITDALSTHVAVLSEDAWNRAMGTVIGVPIISGEPVVAVFHCGVDGLGYADASLVQSVRQDSLGDQAAVIDVGPPGPTR